MTEKGEVTPHVGVWIETENYTLTTIMQNVTPHVGVWIETSEEEAQKVIDAVTPHVGVWIETRKRLARNERTTLSHLMQVCGLKPYTLQKQQKSKRHTSCRCVD